MKNKTPQLTEPRILIKFVRKANSWCKTTFNEKGLQTLEWFSKKEDIK